MHRHILDVDKHFSAIFTVQSILLHFARDMTCVYFFILLNNGFNSITLFIFNKMAAEKLIANKQPRQHKK